MSSIPPKDNSLQFPHFIVLKASAGSGKTYALTRRIIQFLLFEKIPRNQLKNILAVTFSNNAAKEMKERTLSWLKEIYFGNKKKLAELSDGTPARCEVMQERAGRLIEEILGNFADFQIKTIDSFMTTVFKSSAIDFGYNVDFEILMDNRSLMEYAFELFLRNVREGSPEAAALEEIVDSLLDFQKEDGAFLWIPSKRLLEESRKVYRKLSSESKEVEIEEFEYELKKLRIDISHCVEEIEREIEQSGLKRHGQSGYLAVLKQVRQRRFQDLGGKPYRVPPVSKPSNAEEEKNRKSHEKILGQWNQFRDLANRLTVISCRSKYNPYIKTYLAFTRHLDKAKKRQGKIFIEDINHDLSKYLNEQIVPDIYFRMGERIYHFLIDEFQDTSPVQWKNLFPLIENSLSQGGSLFLVGDTKQSIYGFRNADYTIMKDLELVNPFPSAAHEVRELNINYRSKKKILEFNENIFKTRLLLNSDYYQAGKRSGLTDYVQEAEQNIDNDGYVEVSLFEVSEEVEAEKEKIQEKIVDLRLRGYGYRDLAILTQTNEHAVRVTSWLNEKGIPFISYSSLDIRRRKVIGELIALLTFFDSPTDHFSFANFLLGEIFATLLRRDFPDFDPAQLRNFCFEYKMRSPLYKGFQERYPFLWKKYFETLLKVSGFLPLYDLVTEIYSIFELFQNKPGEEAALIKFLEVANEFEKKGTNHLSDFLATTDENDNGNDSWELSVPKNFEAVNVMTIHKAKGLGFPVVILLLYEVKNRGFEFILEEVPGAIHLLKINKGEALCDETLHALYEKEQVREWVNRLNTLYVGLTRPERELHIMGMFKKKENFPFFLFPSGERPPAPNPVYLSETVGEMSPVEIRSIQYGERKREFPLSHARFVAPEERKRGEWIHRILFDIHDLETDIRAQVRNIIDRIKEETHEAYYDPEIERLIETLMMNRHINPFFTYLPGRVIKNEQEFVDASGRLLRMDRVVVDLDRVTVMEYKTGREKRAYENDKDQLKKYLRIAQEIYPDKAAAGLLIYVDRNEVEKFV